MEEDEDDLYGTSIPVNGSASGYHANSNGDAGNVKQEYGQAAEVLMDDEDEDDDSDSVRRSSGRNRASADCRRTSILSLSAKMLR